MPHKKKKTKKKKKKKKKKKCHIWNNWRTKLKTCNTGTALEKIRMKTTELGAYTSFTFTRAKPHPFFLMKLQYKHKEKRKQNRQALKKMITTLASQHKKQ